MMNAVILLLIFWISPVSFVIAEVFSGTISRKSLNRGVFFENYDQKIYFLTAGNSSIENLFDRLSEGDFIQFESTLNPNTEDALTVNDVNFVGLKRLMGLWVSSSSVLKFQNFQEMSFYLRSGRSLRQPKFNYSIFPTNGPEWIMIFSNANSGKTEIATILIDQDRMTVDYIQDDKTTQRISYRQVF